MEYYDYNSNQQQMQDEHNKIELFKIKSKEYLYNEMIKLYINNILIEFKISGRRDLNLQYGCQPLVDELKSNFKYEIVEEDSIYFDKVKRYIYVMDYHSKLLDKYINFKYSFHPMITYQTVLTDRIIDTEHLERKKITFLKKVMEDYIYEDILLFLYEKTDLKIKSISLYGYNSYNYENEIDKHNIKSLSEKRKMKSILENF